MLLDVLNKEGDKVAQLEGKDEVFRVEPKEHLFYEVVKMQLANRRAGTASTKTRAEVSGGGAKPFRQKGTGRARQGSIRSPLNRHGGTAFGPKPRDYSYKVPKKMVSSAMVSALSLKVRDGKLKVLESLDIPEPKTREIANIVKKMGSAGALFVTYGENRNAELAVRNMKNCKVLRVEGLNLYDVLRFDDVLFTKAALEEVERRFGV